MIGATVVLTARHMQGEQVVITDENGKYSFENLAPGEYTTTYYYNNDTFANPKVQVMAGQITLERVLDWPSHTEQLESIHVD